MGRAAETARMKVDLPAFVHAQQADIGEHFQLQLQLARLTFLARRTLARRAVGAGLEMDVAQAAFAAPGEQDFLLRRG